MFVCLFVCKGCGLMTAGLSQDIVLIIIIKLT